MRRISAIAALAASICGPAISETASRAPWDACLRDQAVALDDGQSDARTIAMGVLAACRPKLATWLRAMVPNARDDLIDKAIAAIRDDHLDGVVGLVLTTRREKHNPPEKP